MIQMQARTINMFTWPYILMGNQTYVYISAASL